MLNRMGPGYEARDVLLIINLQPGTYMMHDFVLYEKIIASLVTVSAVINIE